MKTVTTFLAVLIVTISFCCLEANAGVRFSTSMMMTSQSIDGAIAKLRNSQRGRSRVGRITTVYGAADAITSAECYPWRSACNVAQTSELGADLNTYPAKRDVYVRVDTELTLADLNALKTALRNLPERGRNITISENRAVYCTTWVSTGARLTGCVVPVPFEN